MTEILISAFLLIGASATLIGAIGVGRFRDVYTRLHATDMGATYGVIGIVVAGTIFFNAETGFTLKPLLVIPFLFATAPIGAFLLSRAAHRTGPNMAPETIRDDLAEEAGTRTEHE